MTRALLLAEAANPEWVSVPLVGWSLARALAEVADVHLVTQVRNRDAILRAGLVEGDHVTFIDNEAWARPLWALAERLRGGEGKGFTTLQAIGALSYPSFERMVWARFGDDLKAGAYDLVHRITPLTPTWPSPIVRHLTEAKVPFVLGPINGGVPWPREFDAARRAEKEWLSYVRGAAKAVPGRRRTFLDAAAVMAGSRHTLSELPTGTRAVWLPENAVDAARIVPKPDREPGPLRAIFVGRLVPYKGADMALDAAAALMRNGRMTFEIVGDGPEMAALCIQARDLDVRPRMSGWLPHDEVAQRLAAADLLLFPSIREFGGGVVLEAMAAGTPALVVDYAGPAELVTPDTGWTVPLGPREAIVAALSARLSALVSDPADLAQRGRAAQARVARDFTWAAKARQVLSVYDWALGRAGAPSLPEGA